MSTAVSRDTGGVAASLRAVCVVIVLLGAACAGQSASTTASGPPASPPAWSQPSQPPAARVRLVTVATGLDQPVDVAGIPGTAKLAVVEKTGRVLVLTDGHPAKKPLLDLGGQVDRKSTRLNSSHMS